MDSRYVQSCVCAMTLGVVALSACGGGSGGEPDAAAPTYAVRGVAVGLLEPASVRLELDGTSEVVLVPQNGPFVFDTLLHDGDAFTVTLADDSPCVVGDASGVIMGEEPQVLLACESVLLRDLAISGMAAPGLSFAPATTAYDAHVPLAQDSTDVTATVAHAEASLTIAGAPAQSGEPGPAFLLALGDNPVDVVVSHPRGGELTYRVNVIRASALAQYAYAKASNTDGDDWFGTSVALWKDTLAVGAWGESSASAGVNGDQEDNSMEDSGAVYVFRRQGTSWAQEAYIKASNPGHEDWFGWSVALREDVLAVGAPGEDSAATGVGGDQGDDSMLKSGAVYVFRRAGGEWAQEAYIKAASTQDHDWFGWSVALWDDTLAVGTPLENSGARGVGGDPEDSSAGDSGAVYVFRYSDAAWQQEAYIKASNTGAGDEFGRSVALWGDLLAVGAPREASRATGVGGEEDDDSAANSGAVYVFRRSGAEWAQEAYIKASNTGVNHFFGWSVALFDDTLAAGAYQENGGATGVDGDQADGVPRSGAVYVFRRGGGAWGQEAYIKASNTAPDDNFGHSVSLAEDALVVGAIREGGGSSGVDGNDADRSIPISGAAYVFHRRDDRWSQHAYVKASNPGPSDFFGYSVAISADTLAVGANWEKSRATGINGNQNDTSAAASGAVYLFH